MEVLCPVGPLQSVGLTVSFIPLGWDLIRHVLVRFFSATRFWPSVSWPQQKYRGAWFLVQAIQGVEATVGQEISALVS